MLCESCSGDDGSLRSVRQRTDHPTEIVVSTASGINRYFTTGRSESSQPGCYFLGSLEGGTMFFKRMYVTMFP